MRAVEINWEDRQVTEKGPEGTARAASHWIRPAWSFKAGHDKQNTVVAG